MNFATLKGLTIPEGNVTKITDASGRVLWGAVVAPSTATITLECINNGDSGDAKIVITSPEPFAPMPDVSPEYFVTTYTFDASVRSGLCIEVPLGATIKCTAKADSQVGDKAHIKLNGMIVVKGKGSYTYPVQYDATILLRTGQSSGASYGRIEITEQ